jgi:hypothetical protein
VYALHTTSGMLYDQPIDLIILIVIKHAHIVSRDIIDVIKIVIIGVSVLQDL